MPQMDRWEVEVEAGDVKLDGTLTIPLGRHGIIVFVDSTGTCRRSARHRFVAGVLRERGLGTLLLDLPSAEDGGQDPRIAELGFDVDVLARRLITAIDWLGLQRPTMGMRIGLFSSSTGAAAALIAAAQRPVEVRAVVARAGRPDLAGAALARVLAPTLFIVGGNDPRGLALHEKAGEQMRAPHELQIVAGATHLFEEPGKLEAVATLAADWFSTYVRPEQPLEEHFQPHAAR